MPRFLHTADWQIGRQYSRFAPEDALDMIAACFRLAMIMPFCMLAPYQAKCGTRSTSRQICGPRSVSALRKS